MDLNSTGLELREVLISPRHSLQTHPVKPLSTSFKVDALTLAISSWLNSYDPSYHKKENIELTLSEIGGM